MFESLFSLLGEMGIVSRGTGELGFTEVGAVPDVAIRQRQEIGGR